MDNPLDTIELNVPLFIRLLEYAREDAKSDVSLHRIVENILYINRYGGVLTMNDYPTIISSIETEDDIEYEKMSNIRKMFERISGL